MNRLVRALLIALLLTAGSVYAEDLMQQMHLAQAFFDTGQFLQAQKIYENLLKEELEPWQREIITYNSECCLLAAGQWQLVASQTKEQLLQASGFPPLARNAALNNAIISLRMAENLKDKPEAIALLKEAITSLQDAQESDCEIALLEELPRCEEAQDIKEIHSQINSLLSTSPIPEDSSPLKKLHLAFAAALAEFPLKLESITELLNQIQGVSSVAFATLVEAKTLLEKSLAALKQSKPRTARAFLVASDNLVQTAALEKETTPHTLLQDALAEQEQSLHLLLQIKRAAAADGDNPTLNALADQFQQAVLTRSAPFLGMVFAQQVRDFPKACQEKPWDLVIPLFLKGEAAATKAEENLKAKKQEEALTNQLEAINSWKSALDWIRRAETTAQQEEEKQQQQPQQQQNPASLSNSVPQLLQLLEEMEADDKLQPVVNPNRQEVEKPW